MRGSFYAPYDRVCYRRGVVSTRFVAIDVVHDKVKNPPRFLIAVALAVLLLLLLLLLLPLIFNPL